MSTDARDTEALERVLAVTPAWTRTLSAREAVGLEERTLLHCGPPATPHHALVVPTLNSAAVACVFEGWAEDLEEARALVRSGEIRFAPAQGRGVATPMAAVVSPSMQLLELADLDATAAPAYAPINGGGTGGSPAPRFGRATPECVAFLGFLNRELAPWLGRAGQEPLPWLPIVDHGLVHGDDAHLRHDSAHARLVETIRGRLPADFAGSEADAFIAAWPFFHLNFWMAAVCCMLGAARGVAGSSLITAFGGNGARFGLEVAGLPGRWFTCEASPPIGKLRPPHTPESCVGAYGDSALVEAFGLGAMAHRYAPEMQALHADHAPDDLLALPARLLLASHPGLPRSGARVGMSARGVVATGATPVVELGIVDAAGIDGGLGAGLYRPPMAPFSEACEALDAGG